jgi:hypothetical protein
VGEQLELPDEVYGFGSWLLWLVATRAMAVVDRAFAAGPARPSRYYGMVDGHPVPTPSLVAWLLAAAEAGFGLEELSQRDTRLDERQKVLRTIVSRGGRGTAAVQGRLAMGAGGRAQAALTPDSMGTERIASYLGERTCYPAARDLCRQILEAREQTFGLEYPSTLSARYELARWTGNAGDMAGARDQFAALLPIQVPGQAVPRGLRVSRRPRRWVLENLS